jgi:hypothetical protein
MYISHKSNVLQQVHETEWQCRRKAKGLDKSEYWAWLATITTQDDDGNDVITYPSEDFTIVECTDENVQERLEQLGDYVADGVYNITWSKNKVNCEEVLDIDGKSQSPKVYVKSHFKGDDTAKDKRILDQKWADIRSQRDRLLTESDWVVVKAKEEHANASIDSSWIDYRTALRDITKQSDPDDITWPTKP